MGVFEGEYFNIFHEFLSLEMFIKNLYHLVLLTIWEISLLRKVRIGQFVKIFRLKNNLYKVGTGLIAAVNSIMTNIKFHDSSKFLSLHL